MEGRQRLGRRGGHALPAAALGHGQEGGIARRRLGGRGLGAGHFLAALGHHLAAARILQPFPQAQVAAEFAFLVVELGVLLVGLLLGLQRPISAMTTPFGLKASWMP